MALTRAKYKRLPDLWIAGTEARLDDDTVIWLQVPNQFQRDECRHDAQSARARLVMALKSEGASAERDKVRAGFLATGPDRAVVEMSALEHNRLFLKAMNSIDDDPDWTERLDILRRDEATAARAPEDIETQLVEDLNNAYLAEAQRRTADEVAEYEATLTQLSKEDLLAKYVDVYMERRGDAVAEAEFVITELWYAARACAGTQDEHSVWSHRGCDGHSLTAFETKEQVRDLPDNLIEFLGDKLHNVQPTVREAGNSHKQGSS